MTTTALAMPTMAAGADWSTPSLLLRFGLPIVIVGIGVALYLWGRREQREARSQIGMRGGFGGPPGTLDIGTDIGFGIEPGERGPDRSAGRPRILAGLVAIAAGALLLSVVMFWKVLS